MDVDFDCASVHYGLTKSQDLMDSLTSLSSTFANTNITNDEMTTLHLIQKSQSLIDNTMKPAVEEVQRRLSNTKTVLINMSPQAELFFQYTDTGLLDENLIFTDVPYYSQTDYWHVGFADTNIGDCGCGYTSMCMAVSYLKNEILTPDIKAAAADAASTNLEGKMMHFAEMENVNVYKEEYIDYDKLRERLAEGKMCIVLVKDRSHFVLCKGVTDDGRVLVNDPYGKWATTEPYTEADLNRGSSGMVWVIDPYQNVGAASNNIGKVTVSQNVINSIQAANEVDGYTQITSSKYLKAVEKATGAKASKNYTSIIGPSAARLANMDTSNRNTVTNLSADSSKADMSQINNTDYREDYSNYNDYNDYNDYSSSGDTSSGGNAPVQVNAGANSAPSTGATVVQLSRNSNNYAPTLEQPTEEQPIVEEQAPRPVLTSLRATLEPIPETATYEQDQVPVPSNNLGGETNLSATPSSNQVNSGTPTKVSEYRPQDSLIFNNEDTSLSIEDVSTSTMDNPTGLDRKLPEMMLGNNDIPENETPEPSSDSKISSIIQGYQRNPDVIGVQGTTKVSQPTVSSSNTPNSKHGINYLALAAGTVGSLAVGVAAVNLIVKKSEEDD